MDKKVRVLLKIILIGWGVLLIAVSLSPIRFRMGVALGDRWHIHRLAHCAAFGALAFLLSLLGRRMPQRLLGLAGVIALGSIIEVFQHLIYSIPVETWDIRDDTYGALVGFLGATVLVAVSRQRARMS